MARRRPTPRELAIFCKGSLALECRGGFEENPIKLALANDRIMTQTLAMRLFPCQGRTSFNLRA